MLNKLCNYYLECLDREEIQTYISFPSRIPSPDYAIQGKGMLESDQLRNELLNEQGKELIRKARMDQTREIMVGYPVRTRSVNGKLRVEPVLLFEVDQESNIWWREPQVNISAIMDGPSEKDSGATEQARKAADHFAHSIGILENERTPSPRELLNNILKHRPDWEFTKEPQSEGLHNRVALFSTIRKSDFTKSLRAELNRLARVTDSQSSALGHWLGSPLSRHRNESSAPTLEILPMNGEQRHAIELGLKAPLTVITGPPGTGKSQVIVDLLASAANAGQTVLFASKNNKAVDVVRERFDEQCQRPVLLRLGPKQEDQLRSQITGILAAAPNPGAERAYRNSINEKVQIQENIRQLAEQESRTIRLRNETDELERRAEEARNLFPEEAFLNMTTSSIGRMEPAFKRLLNAARDTDIGRHGFLIRLLWNIWFRDDILLKLHSQIQRTRKMAQSIGFPLPEQAPHEGNAAEYEEIAETLVAKIPHAEVAARYQEKLRDLQSARRIEDIQRERMREMDSLVKNDRRIWENWIDTQPGRMDRTERENLLQLSNTIEQLKTTENYRELIQQYEEQTRHAMKKVPCWAVTSLSARGRIPMRSGLFDILVVDEASQCDIASALPLLYRAKRAVIIGDPMQLRHICKIEKPADIRLREKHGLGKSSQWSYPQTSLFDRAATLAEGENIVQLRDHHRSHPDIIGFSNQQFYGGILRMATDLQHLKRSDSKRAQPAIRWLHQAGSTVRAGRSAINAEEANAVVETIRKLIAENEYQGTIGVVTPYRKQADRILGQINQDETLRRILDRQEFVAGTAHKFQGDERDLIIFSPVISKGAEDFLIRFAQSENLLNVAVTRARAELIIVGDQNTIKSWGNLHKLRQHVQETEFQNSQQDNMGKKNQAYRTVPNAELVSPWEETLHEALKNAGIHTIPQYQPESLNYYIDLAIIQGDRRLAIEVDGEQYHKNWDGELCYRDQIRNQRLMREGWDVMRFWVYEIRDRLDQTVEKVKMWVARDSRQE